MRREEEIQRLWQAFPWHKRQLLRQRQTWLERLSQVDSRRRLPAAHPESTSSRGLELRQTVWVMQAVGEDGQWENTALEGFERYGLVTSIIQLSSPTIRLFRQKAT